MQKQNRQKVMDNRATKRNAKSKSKIQSQKHQEQRLESLPRLVAKNELQSVAIDALRDKQMVIILGSAGTGKTEIACWHTAVRWLKNEITDIMLSRPYVTLGKDNGAVPGNDFQKLLPFTMSALLKYKKYLGVNVLKNNLRTEDIDLLFNEKSGIFVVALEKLQGYSFDENTVLIIDEGQNMSIAQAKSAVTRAERGCQVIISGDITQSAIGPNNGLKYLLDKIKQHPHPDIAVVEFVAEDNCREGISKHFTKIFEQEGAW